jgi:heparan-alpha-glucosaminide N-acetyltransferase
MTKPTRITSIDIVRGLTILTMIFVNDLASIHNIPAWMKHAPTEADTMTFVDLVFPAFLFIVGMAIPFAIQNRINRGDTVGQMWKHIFIRTIGLLVLGVFMVNLESLNSAATGMSYSWWMLLLFIAAILVWNQYPNAAGLKRIMVALLRFIGVIILIILVVIYRGGEGDQVHWMQTSWWGILGLIGWVYLTCCAVYFLFRKNLPAMIGILALFIALYIGDKDGKLDFLAPITNYI